MAISAWTESIPSGTSTVGTFPAYARAVFAAITAGMAVEHYWNGSGGGSDASTGDLLPGASRAFFAAQSDASAPAQNIGRVFLASDTSRLLLYDSSGTYLGGTPFLAEHATSANTSYWVRFTGSYSTTATTGSTAITFPTPFVNTIPAVFQSIDTDIWTVAATPIGNGLSAFSSYVSIIALGGATVTVRWEAIGTVSSASY